MKRLIIAFLFVLFGAVAQAEAIDFTVQGTTVPNWQQTTAPQLYVFYSNSFTASDGTIVIGGNPANKLAYKKVTCTLSVGTVTIPSFTIKSTEDGIDSTTETVSFYFYTTTGALIRAFAPYTNLKVPATFTSATGCSPAGTCASLSELKNYTTNVPFPANTGYYTSRQIDAIIGAFNPNTVGITLQVKRLNNVRIADQFSGDKWCDKIQAADSDLGATEGEIWVSQLAGTSACTSNLTITTNHVVRFIQGGTYPLGTASVLMAPNTGWIGTGMRSTVFTSTQTTGSVFKSSNTSVLSKSSTLSDFHLQGADGSSGGIGIDLQNTRLWEVRNVVIDFFRVAGDTGIGLKVWSDNVNGAYNRFYNVSIENCDTGLLLDCTGASSAASNNHFYGLNIDVEVIGIDIKKTGTNGAIENSFFGPRIQGAATMTFAIRVASNANTFWGCTIESPNGTGVSFSGAGATGNVFEGKVGITSGTTFTDTSNGSNHLILPGLNRWQVNGNHVYSNSATGGFDVTWSSAGTTQPMEHHLSDSVGRRYNFGLASSGANFFLNRQSAINRLLLEPAITRLNAEGTAAVQFNSTTNSGTGGIAVYTGGSPSTQVASIDGTGAAVVASQAIGGGTVITKTVVYAPSLTPAAVAMNTTAEQDFTVTGLTTADKVIVNGPAPLAGTGIVNARVKAADTLSITFVNATGGALTPTAGTYNVIAIRN